MRRNEEERGGYLDGLGVFYRNASAGKRALSHPKEGKLEVDICWNWEPLW